MKVYVLIRIDIEFYWIDIVGVYFNKEKAEKFKLKWEKFEENKDEWEQYKYKIVERRLQ